MNICRIVVCLLAGVLALATPMRAAQLDGDFDVESVKWLLDDGGGRVLSGPEGNVLIMISRLGDGERSKRLATRRGDELRRYVLDHPFIDGQFPADRVVCAVGVPVGGRGCVEIYVGGILRYSIRYMKGRTGDWRI